MPWQQQVADVALELDDAGKLAFREIVLTVPRQSGKTRLELILILTRALARPRQGIRYTAQSGVMARQKLVDDWLPELEQSRFGSLFTTRLINGHEGLRFSNGSRLELVAGTRKSGHGLVIDLAVIDEAFALVDARLEQALKPAMVTRSSPQLWVVSTAGTPDESPYLWGKVEAGRQLAEAGVSSGVAFFEWSAPEDADAADPATWRACMPALGHTVTEEAVQADFQTMDAVEFRRAYLNHWTTPSTDPVVELETWQALTDVHSEALDPVVLAADAGPDRGTASIVASGRRADGKVHLEVLEHRRGVSWVPSRLAELARRHNPSAVVLDAVGPGASLLTELEQLKVRRLVTVSARELSEACGAFFDAVEDGKIRHLGQAELTAAVDAGRKRSLGDAWAWSRRSSSADITPLVACTLAHWVLLTKRPARYMWTPAELFGAGELEPDADGVPEDDDDWLSDIYRSTGAPGWLQQMQLEQIRDRNTSPANPYGQTREGSSTDPRYGPWRG